MRWLRGRRVTAIMCVALVAGFAKVPDLHVNKCTMAQTLQGDRFGSQFQNITSTAAALHVNKCTMTQTLQGDGFGSQFQNIISTAVFAQTLNKHFCVTPIESMEHNYDNRSTFLREVNELINLPVLSSQEDMDIEKCEVKKGWLVSYIVQEANQLDVRTKLGNIRKQFLGNKRSLSELRKHAAVHIRRQNSFDNRNTVSHDEVVCFVMREILTQNSNIQFHVFSQGDISEFWRYQNDSRIVLRLDEPINVTFTEMVVAKILVTATSSFSYAAALLSEGEIWAPRPFWHNYPSFWKTYQLSRTLSNFETCLP